MIKVNDEPDNIIYRRGIRHLKGRWERKMPVPVN